RSAARFFARQDRGDRDTRPGTGRRDRQSLRGAGSRASRRGRRDSRNSRRRGVAAAVQSDSPCEGPANMKELQRVRRIAMAMPGAEEKLPHGEPTWFAKKKVFAMFANNHHD